MCCAQCRRAGPASAQRPAHLRWEGTPVGADETSCPRIDHSDKSLIMACRATAAHVRIFRYRLRSGASQTALGPLWHQARMHWFIPVMPGKSGVLRIWVWGGKSWVRMTAQTSRVAGSVALRSRNHAGTRRISVVFCADPELIRGSRVVRGRAPTSLQLLNSIS